MRLSSTHVKAMQEKSRQAKNPFDPIKGNHEEGFPNQHQYQQRFNPQTMGPTISVINYNNPTINMNFNEGLRQSREK